MCIMFYSQICYQYNRDTLNTREHPPTPSLLVKWEKINSSLRPNRMLTVETKDHSSSISQIVITAHLSTLVIISFSNTSPPFSVSFSHTHTPFSLPLLMWLVFVNCCINLCIHDDHHQQVGSNIFLSFVSVLSRLCFLVTQILAKFCHWPFHRHTPTIVKLLRV